VDGFKEDYYGFGGFGLRDDKIDPTNNRLMQQGKDIIERNGYLSVDGDLQRINDFNYDQDQDRGPVNALAFAYSGFPLVYPDIVGGTFGEQRFAIARTSRMETYMMRNAQWASLHSSMSMGEPPWSFQERTGRVMLSAAQLHQRLQPYLYALGVRASQDGYPWPMTPLPVAFPTDPQVYGRENDRVRGYEWLIGDSLLATPLYGDDYDSASSRDVYLPAGKWMDYDTGKLYAGATMLRNFALPVDKTPLFVGGSGIVIEREGQQIVARVYPLGGVAKQGFLLPGAEKETVLEVSARNLREAKVIDQTNHRAVAAGWERFAFQFPIEGGHTYSIEAH
jgi:alpha-glucosidase (family GH31 glycosyl hydrolase)